VILFRQLGVAVLLVTPTLAAAQSMARADSSSATLAPGDLLRVSVWRRPELSGDFVIAPDSTITHPLYREVKVAGIPLKTVEERVRTFLAKYETNVPFVISPLLRVFVGGEVRQPNVYNVPPGTTVAQVVALAGGPTERGKLEEVSLVHQERREALDLTSLDTHAATMEVRSGDQLLVARRRNFFIDVLAPSSSVFAAAAAVASIIIQLTR
jgi:Periplasmic protein involved in polysaccharide export